MTDANDDLSVLRIARDKGFITSSQFEQVREEHSRVTAAGRRKSPTRIAIESGILSDQLTMDLQTEVWIRELPRELDEYRLRRLLGRGGMAVVFEAEDMSLGKAVAIKLLLPEFANNDAYLARFHREARIAAKLTHPNTVQVFRAGERDGIQYLVMEYVDGEPVSDIIRRRGRIPEEEAVEIALQVAGALEEAAELGIIHRDIKPGNILFSKWQIPKLADFGIAKEVSDIRDPMIQQSLTMGVVGTPTYMSPEQARGARNLTIASDIYSLGATLYHMVVGDLPFPMTTPQETMVKVVSEAARPPLDLAPNLSEGTAAVICRMMAKRAEDRYASYRDLKEDLQAARDGEEVSLDYDEAVLLLQPDGRLHEAPQPRSRTRKTSDDAQSLMRVFMTAGAVAAAGLLMLWLMRGCG